MKWLKRNKNVINPLELNWGIITPDGFDKNENKFIHVINSEMVLKRNIDLNKYFIKSKFNYFVKHLPENSTQKFILDLRGQNVIIEKMNKFITEIIDLIDNEYFEIEYKI